MGAFWFAVLALFPALVLVLRSAPAPDLAITDRMHHLRSGTEREWAEFAERAEGIELVLPFQATANEDPHTLRIRHRDLKQPWRVRLNGKEMARLPLDEADTITYWAVPPGTLKDGANELRVQCTGKASDDVLIGEVGLIGRPREDVLSDATIDLSVHDEPGASPIPSRLTIANEQGTLVSVQNISGPDHAVRPGVVYARDGTVRLKVPAGRFVIHAGRGFEYSVASVKVAVSAGEHISRRLAIRRQVETTGWAAMDTHLHTGTHAKHGDATVEERMLTIAGEGIELPVSTEHNMRVDFAPHVGEAGVKAHFTPIVGSEVTTPSLGHFNVFPTAGGAATIDQKAPGWAQLRQAIAGATTDAVVVLNHGRDVHGGFRPLGRTRHISIAGEDLDGWSLPANAMEVVNSGAVMSDALALPRDWMGMLNRGVMLTPVGASDSHDVSRYIVGQGRTYVRVDDRDPGALDMARVVESVRRGRVMVSYGLLAEISADDRGPGDLVRAARDLNVRIRVKGPEWTRADRVALYANGEKVREEEIRKGANPGVKWDATWRLPIPAHDVHLVAIASGPGVTAPYWPTAKPYQPTSIEFTPYVLGVSGAIFVDADGSGRFESAHEYAQRTMSMANSDVRALATKLGAYDTAVAIQAASLLRSQDPAGFDARIESLIHAAPPHVASGFRRYLDGWKQAGGPAAPLASEPIRTRRSSARATARPLEGR
jgi:hypothetical protein